MSKLSNASADGAGASASSSSSASASAAAPVALAPSASGAVLLQQYHRKFHYGIVHAAVLSAFCSAEPREFQFLRFAALFQQNARVRDLLDLNHPVEAGGCLFFFLLHAVIGAAYFKDEPTRRVFQEFAPPLCHLIRTTLDVDTGAASALLYLCQHASLTDERGIAYQTALALLDRGCEVDKRDESTGRTALLAQAAIHQVGVTYSAWGLLLLLERGADIDAQDLAGNTAMHYLAMRSKAEALRGIAEAGWMDGTNPTLCNKEGKTALQVAQLKQTSLERSAEAEVLALLQLQHDMRPERAEIMLNSLCDNTPLVPDLARLVIACIEEERERNGENTSE